MFIIFTTKFTLSITPPNYICNAFEKKTEILFWKAFSLFAKRKGSVMNPRINLKITLPQEHRTKEPYI